MANPIQWVDSEIERVKELVLEEADAILRCPAEIEEEATQEVLSKLEPHQKGASNVLDTIGRVREIIEKEHARRGAFMMLLDTARLHGHE